MKPTRRQWLSAAPAAAAVASAATQASTAQASTAQSSASAAARPNVILVISDQFRWDCIGAMGLNPMNLTPNLDRMAARGVLFRSAFCNQPVCAPARGSIFTGQYASKHGVWRNGIGLPETATTLASEMKRAGYSTNYIGKWHLAPPDPGTAAEPHGPVRPQHRGGFQDLWEAANALEWTSHAYEGDLFDGEGKPIHFANRYRADFMTDRAQLFLRSRAAKSPFLLTLSYLEVHHRNDKDTFDPPREFVNRYPNPFIPQDLRPLPGSWPSQISDYFACVAKMDEIVGTIRQTLAENDLDKNTILMFTSDHGNHFRTRNSEYKRSPHESSIHVPLIVEGPGFNRGMQVSELVSQVDYAPTLLSAAGLGVPASMQGHNILPLLEGHRENWRNEVYFEMSEYVTGRGLRTPQYTYAVAAPRVPGWKDATTVEKYVEYMLYDLYADPHQHLNLAGRAPYQKTAADLRQRLRARMLEASGDRATIDPAWFPYS